MYLLHDFLDFLLRNHGVSSEETEVLGLERMARRCLQHDAGRRPSGMGAFQSATHSVQNFGASQCPHLVQRQWGENYFSRMVNELFLGVMTILSSRASQPIAQSNIGPLAFTSFLSWASESSPRALRVCQTAPAIWPMSLCMQNSLRDPSFRFYLVAGTVASCLVMSTPESLLVPLVFTGYTRSHATLDSEIQIHMFSSGMRTLQ